MPFLKSATQKHTETHKNEDKQTF